MPRYYVDVPERHYATYEVEADTHWDALQKIKASRSSPINMEYCDEGEFRDWMVVEKDSSRGMASVDEAERMYPREAKGLSK